MIIEEFSDVCEKSECKTSETDGWHTKRDKEKNTSDFDISNFTDFDNYTRRNANTFFCPFIIALTGNIDALHSSEARQR